MQNCEQKGGSVRDPSLRKGLNIRFNLNFLEKGLHKSVVCFTLCTPIRLH